MITIPTKIPIRIYPLFWLLIFMIGWLSSGSIPETLIWAVVIFFSVLFHEFGHALTAIAFGQKAEIDLVGLGGLTRRSGPKLKLWQEFLVVLDGPFAGFLLFIIVSFMQPWLKTSHWPAIAYAAQIAIYINLVWNVLNLLPVQPLDGGHLLRIVLEGAFGFKGVKFSFLLSVILSALLSLFFFFIQAILAGALFLMLAFESYRAWSEIRTMTPQDTNAQLQGLLKDAQEDLKAGRQHEAFSKFLSLRDQVKEGVLYVIATQYLAQLLAQQGQIKQAYDWLMPLEGRLSPDYLRFLQQLSYRLQKWEDVIRIGNRAYQTDPHMDSALLNAFASAIMGKANQAVGWLRTASEMGLPDLAGVIQKREFDAIRDSIEFKAFLRSHA